MRNLFLAAAGAAGLLAARRLLRQRHAISFDGRTVVITGGSRGLGLELARRFAAEGARPVLLARSDAELARARQDLAGRGADVLTFACDLRDREDVQRTVAAILEARGRLDVLVHNAGVIQAGPLEHMTTADFEEAMAIHTWAALHLMQAVVPHMKARGEGRIVNVSSIGGLVSLPHLVPYSTSKFALVGLSDGMRAELAKDGIRVTTVCPGLMRTGSHVNALFKGAHDQEYAWFAGANAFPLLSTSSAHAARAIVEACRYGVGHLTITPQARLLHDLDALFPNLTASLMGLAARLLPGPTGPGGDRLQAGWDSRSVAPAALTHLSDQAIPRNNEQDGRL